MVTYAKAYDDHLSIPASCVTDARRWLNEAF